MTDKMREAFEKWAVDQGINVSWKSGDEYMVGGTIITWNAWQAAQSAAVPVVGDVVAYDDARRAAT